MRKLVSCLLFLVSCLCHAQLLDSLSLEHADEFTSIDSALKNPEQVVKLILRKNKLNTFPKEIFQFPNLQYLDLSKNKLTEIPEDIGKLKNLQKLLLSRNNITSIPQEISELKNLRELHISQNNIEYLPPKIGDLANLRYLDLYSNNIQKIPNEIGKLKQLKTLDVRGIMMSDSEQEHIQKLVPHTTVYFSASCKCKE